MYRVFFLKVITILLCLFSELPLWILRIKDPVMFIRVDAWFLLLVYVQCSASFGLLYMLEALYKHAGT